MDKINVIRELPDRKGKRVCGVQGIGGGDFMQKQLEKRISKQGISHRIHEEAFLQHINYPRAGVNIRQPVMPCCASEKKGGVVQRALFIRKSSESVTKERKEMGARVTGGEKLLSLLLLIAAMQKLQM